MQRTDYNYWFLTCEHWLRTAVPQEHFLTFIDKITGGTIETPVGRMSN